MARIVGVAILVCAGCSPPTEPVTLLLVPGRYVLTTIDGAPAPFITGRLERGDTLWFDHITYDTVVVIDDSSARQHVRTANMSRLRDEAPVENGAQESNATKTVVFRDDEVVLVASYSLGPVYFSRVGSDLFQRIPIRHVRCAANNCQMISNRIGRARYVRQ